MKEQVADSMTDDCTHLANPEMDSSQNSQPVNRPTPFESLSQWAIEAAERGLLPDPLIRFGIRRLLKQRLKEESAGSPSAVALKKKLRLERLSQGPIALEVDAANAQHYEVPSELYEEMLGPRLKYSSCLWDGTDKLERAEEGMLFLSGLRAQLGPGQQILELGCGWGSLTLWMAEKYPTSQITAVSNSTSQADYIRQRASGQGLRNVRVFTCNVADYQPDRLFDRVVSIEMFEHLRNYREMLRKVALWLKPEGKFWVHIFCHRDMPYFFTPRSGADWMARTFFSGGIMPCDSMFHHFQEDLEVENHWRVSGVHYSKTLEAWMDRLDKNRDRLLPIFENHYGVAEAKRWFGRWRIFLMACSELFGYNHGNEWFVTHTLMRRGTKEGNLE